HDGEIAERLDDAGGAAAAARLETLHHQALADRRLGDDQAIDVEIVVVLGVGDGRVQRLLDVQRDALLREGELVDGRGSLLAADGGGHEVELARADADGAQHDLGLVVRLAAGIGWRAHRLVLRDLLVARVVMEGPRRRELAELVTDHLLGDVHRDELPAVVDAERQADELRQDRRAPRPGLDHFAAHGLARLLGLLDEAPFDEGTLPNGTCHCAVSSSARRATAADDELVRRLVLAGLLALGRLAPRGDRVAAARGAAFAAAVRMGGRVHDDAAVMRTPAHPAGAARLADRDVHVIGVRHRTNGGAATAVHQALLARVELDLGVTRVLAYELGVGAGRTRQLAALADLQLDVMHDGTHRHV